MKGNTKFYVKALWDDEIKVFYSESNIVGLHIEANSITQFEEVLYDIVAELIISNHLSTEELVEKSFKDIFSPIIYERPTDAELGVVH